MQRLRSGGPAGWPGAGDQVRQAAFDRLGRRHLRVVEPPRASERSYHAHALAEQDFRNRRAKHVVYGHSHAAEIVPLDASYAEGYVLDQMYFNTGTWRRVYGLTRLASGEHEFIASDAMKQYVEQEARIASSRPRR